MRDIIKTPAHLHATNLPSGYQLYWPAGCTTEPNKEALIGIAERLTLRDGQESLMASMTLVEADQIGMVWKRQDGTVDCRSDGYYCLICKGFIKPQCWPGKCPESYTF